MISAAEILSIIEEQKAYSIKQLAKKLEIQQSQLKEILTSLSRHNLVEFSAKTGKIALPKWLININKKMKAIKPAVGEIILPKYQEVQIQDILIGNYTGNDLELKVRLRAKLKEIAICLMA